MNRFLKNKVTDQPSNLAVEASRSKESLFAVLRRNHPELSIRDKSQLDIKKFNLQGDQVMEKHGIRRNYDNFNQRSKGETLIESRPPVDNMKSFYCHATKKLRHVFCDYQANQMTSIKYSDGTPTWELLTDSCFISKDCVLSDDFLQDNGFLSSSNSVRHSNNTASTSFYSSLPHTNSQVNLAVDRSYL